MPKGLIRPESATALLATPRRQKLLEHIWQRTSLSRRQFKTLYLALLEHYAELVQLFPASEGHHHAYPGGMLDHELEIVAYALKLRQSHLLPAGMKPEEQAAQAEVWTAGTAYAALLHDIGKIAVDLHVEVDSEALREAGTAPQTGQWIEHLDMRSDRGHVNRSGYMDICFSNPRLCSMKSR